MKASPAFSKAAGSWGRAPSRPSQWAKFPIEKPIFGSAFHHMKTRNRPAVQAGRFFRNSSLFLPFSGQIPVKSEMRKKKRPNRMGRFLYQNRKSRPEQPGLCIFQDMQNPGGHGFFKRGISLAEASDLGRLPKTPQPFREGWRSVRCWVRRKFCYLRFAIGTYLTFLDSGLNAGRMMRPPKATSSMRCAIQPTIRAVAKSGVNISSGMPSIL